VTPGAALAEPTNARHPGDVYVSSGPDYPVSLQEPTPTVPSVAVVEATWPTKLDKDDDGSVTIILEKHEGEDPISTEIVIVDGENERTVPVAARCPIEVFDVGAEATANLTGTGFTIEFADPLDQLTKQLSPDPGRSVVDWLWNVAPKEPGTRNLTLSITFKWVEDERDDTCIWRSEPLTVEVTSSWFTMGNPTTPIIFGMVSGSGLTIPVVIGFLSRLLTNIRKPPDPKDERRSSPYRRRR
jgi:hypothetical protein